MMAKVEPEQPLDALYGVFRSELLRFMIARTGDAGEAERLVLLAAWRRMSADLPVFGPGLDLRSRRSRLTPKIAHFRPDPVAA
jgi:hypothetical protein